LARIRALLRRRDAPYREEIRVGDLRIDRLTRKVERGGMPIDLSPKEYAFLEYMALRAGELVTRDDLSEHVWDEDYNTFTNLVEVYILRLRRKIDSGRRVKLIRTRRGEGYMLTGDARA
jgi:two-component system copper resistance phosphate regulon response regulator CusR